MADTVLVYGVLGREVSLRNGNDKDRAALGSELWCDWCHYSAPTTKMMMSATSGAAMKCWRDPCSETTELIHAPWPPWPPWAARGEAAIAGGGGWKSEEVKCCELSKTMQGGLGGN